MQELDGRRVVVTGGAGFIGRAVVRALAGAGADVTVADRRAPADPEVRTVVGDLADPTVRRAAVPDGTDGIVHLAALTSVLASRQDPVGTYRANVEATAGLLERAREIGAGRFVLASTNAVVGDVGAGPITEDLSLRPLTPYGATKAAAEMLLSAYRASYGIGATALRLTNVYGGGMGNKDSFVPRLMRAARDGGEVTVYGDGTQVRDLVHVDDVADAVLLAWRTAPQGPLIVGAGRSLSVLDLIAEVRAVTGAPLPVRHVPAPAGEMPAVVVRTDRIRALGWAPRVDLATGLAGVWEEFRTAVPAGSGA